MKVSYLIAFLILLAGFGAHPALCRAGQRTLTVAGVRLHLGMTFEDVKDAFKGTRYGLRRVAGARDAYAISAVGGPPFESPGNLTFKDGKLWWIGKNWGNYFGPDAASVFNAIYGILVSSGKSAMDAKIRAIPVREPGVVRHEIRMELSDGRRISFSFSEIKDVAENVAVVEMLGGR